MAGRGSLFDIQVAPCIGPYPSCLQTILALKAPSLRSQGSPETWGLPLILRSLQTQYLPGIYERPLRLAHCWSQPQVLDYCEWSKAKENNADGWAQAELALSCHNQNSNNCSDLQTHEVGFSEVNECPWRSPGEEALLSGREQRGRRPKGVALWSYILN